MRNMTRMGSHLTIATPFDGRTFTFKGETARLFTSGEKRYMTIDSARTGLATFEITRVIGGRTREDFAGLRVPAPGQQAEDPREWILPASFAIRPEELRLKGYSVMVKERPGLHVAAVWEKTCLLCHNTAPAAWRWLGELGGKDAVFQAPRLSARLPAPAQWNVEITDQVGFIEAVRRELEELGAELSRAARTPRASAIEAANALNAELRGEHLVDVGIGCEACHGGSAEHVANPTRALPSFAMRSPLMRARTGSGQEPADSEWINRTCAQCHQVLFSRYPYTWEGGTRNGTPGGSTVNSGEARDFLLGHCSGEMTCTSCHDPHHQDDPTAMARLRSPAGNGVCTSCHTTLSDEAALTAHTHHQAASSGSACLECHMPRKNMGLDTKLTTYHRIGSPTDRERVEGDRPLECALCHSRATVGELTTALKEWWGRSYDERALIRLYDDLRAEVLVATALKGKPHEQVVAVHSLAAAGHPRADELIRIHLVHPYPQVRYHAKAALEHVHGGPLPIDLHQERSSIEQQIEAWVRSR